MRTFAILNRINRPALALSVRNSRSAAMILSRFIDEYSVGARGLLGPFTEAFTLPPTSPVTTTPLLPCITTLLFLATIILAAASQSENQRDHKKNTMATNNGCFGELDSAKLPDLLELKYHTVRDGAAQLGGAETVWEAFAGFQRHLYD